VKNVNRIKKEKAIPNDAEIKVFRSILLRWYRRNGRSYPWRDNCSPFHVLLAEMMLQRTKADQVVPVFVRAVDQFPSPRHMAKASINDLESLLKPLGLSWRIPNFKHMAIQLVERFKGIVPRSREELTSLPGVGDYVAGAVLSIAFNQPEWVVDANIVRLFRRYFGIETTAEGRRDRHVIGLAKRYTSRRKPKSSILAVLDHTALICTPRSPHCPSCPLRKGCTYCRYHRVQEMENLDNKRGKRLSKG